MASSSSSCPWDLTSLELQVNVMPKGRGVSYAGARAGRQILHLLNSAPTFFGFEGNNKTLNPLEIDMLKGKKITCRFP